MKKAQTIILLAAVIFMAFTQRRETVKSSGKFIVTGTIDTTAGSLFYTSYKRGDSIISDSFKLAVDKKVRLSGMIDEPTRFNISPIKNQIEMPTMEPVGKYMIWVEAGKTTHFVAQKSVLIASGTKMQDEQNRYDKQKIGLNDFFKPLIERRAEAKRNGTEKAKENEFDLAFRNAIAKWETTSIQYIKQHPHSFTSLNIIKQYNGFPMDKAKAMDAFNSLSDEVKNSAQAKKLKESMGLEGKLAIGATAPDFTEQNTEGKPVKLSSMRGKYVLLDFWASWCIPCRAENPNLKKAYEKYHQKGFDILSVSFDDKKEAWLKAVKDDKLSWLQISDLKGFDGTSGKLYNIHAIPDNYLLDKEGKIIGRNFKGEELEKKLGEVLN